MLRNLDIKTLQTYTLEKNRSNLGHHFSPISKLVQLMSRYISKNIEM